MNDKTVDKRNHAKWAAEKETLMYPLIDDLLKYIPNKYELVLLASLRAKQIIHKSKMGGAPIEELEDEPSRDLPMRKALTQALYEIADGKLERDKLYFFEYLESFRRGDEEIQLPANMTPRAEFEFVPPEKIEVAEESIEDSEQGFFEDAELEEE